MMMMMMMMMMLMMMLYTLCSSTPPLHPPSLSGTTQSSLRPKTRSSAQMQTSSWPSSMPVMPPPLFPTAPLFLGSRDPKFQCRSNQAQAHNPPPPPPAPFLLRNHFHASFIAVISCNVRRKLPLTIDGCVGRKRICTRLIEHVGEDPKP
jgi:hypothetical protein